MRSGPNISIINKGCSLKSTIHEVVGMCFSSIFQLRHFRDRM